ncbi:dTDP-4-dehydrorhamnose 3,5-epimerase [Mesorhizobium sp. NPDC059054]|uniref:dTDP-4-dehydrorhamnose 3,5-epimerase n=1 Tax=Mesorhizobium sp. NPDC059054 TaxID=3346711 RepID=UPI0036C77A33
MQIEMLPIPGLALIIPRRFRDSRGWFSESWNKRALETAGLNLPEFVQDNHSLSHEPSTVRGLHFQSPPHAQGKLVRCGRGRLFDAVVDVRKGSPMFGQWFGIDLSLENGHQLWIPPGLLHGFVTLEPDTEIIYKCTDHYDSACDGSVRWDSCGIDWPLLGMSPILSDKDAQARPFAAFETPFVYGNPA